MRPADLSSLMYIGIKGTVIALDRFSGNEYWRTSLKGCEFVNVVMADYLVYATVRGEIYCLDPLTGRILWNNPLKGMGWGMITIAGQSIVPLAAKRAADAQSASAAAGASAATG